MPRNHLIDMSCVPELTVQGEKGQNSPAIDPSLPRWSLEESYMKKVNIKETISRHMSLWRRFKLVILGLRWVLSLRFVLRYSVKNQEPQFSTTPLPQQDTFKICKRKYKFQRNLTAMMVISLRAKLPLAYHTANAYWVATSEASLTANRAIHPIANHTTLRPADFLSHVKAGLWLNRHNATGFGDMALTQRGLLGVVLHLHHRRLHRLDVADQFNELLHLGRQLTRLELQHNVHRRH